MSNQTLSLVLVAFVGSLLAATVLAVHGLCPASVALGIGQAGLTGAFALATPGRSLTLTAPGGMKP
jgi:hypothetical protein